ncbi:MAG: HlyD family secretion protein [Verrucomicrobiota bacterium]
MNSTQPPPSKPDPLKEPPNEGNPQPAPPAFYKKPVMILILAVVAVLGIVYTATLLQNAFTHESTDDAAIDGRIISIAPKVSGKIAAVYIADNQEVKKGDLLFEIDPRDFESVRDQRKAALDVALAQQKSAEAAVEQAQAHIGTIEAGYASAKASLDAAVAAAKRQHGDLQRNQKLAATGAISAQEFDHSTSDDVSANANMESKSKQADAAAAFLGEAHTQVTAASAQSTAATAEIEMAKAQLAQAELQLSYTKVTAPEDGRITNKSVEPGSYVQIGQALFALVPREIWVTANFKETQITRMHPGQPATVQVDASPGRAFRAHVDSIQAGSGSRFSLMPPENSTGNFVKVVQRVPVKIVFDENMDAIKIPGPGMSALPSVQIRSDNKVQIVIGIIAIAAILMVLGGATILARSSRTN